MSVEPSRPSVMTLIGQVLDERYTVVELLGEGAMGAVYRAERPDGPPVAVKVLHEDLGDNAELRERFEREARALFGLEHPNILGVHDFGVFNRAPYLVMELLEGIPLDKYVEDYKVPPTMGLLLARQILHGLAFAHGQGVLHRDLKTENVFVAQQPDGTFCAKLLDFGLVKFVDDDRWGASKKLTVQGSVFGTPAYMSPEQCSGAPTDASTDVYACGVMLFELMTGVWPFMEESRMAMFRAHLTQPPPKLAEAVDGLEFRPELDAVVAKAMAKATAERYPDAGAMLSALEAVPTPPATPIATPVRQEASNAAAGPPTPPTPPAPAAPNAGRKVFWLGTGISLFVVATIIVGIGLWLVLG